MKNVRMTIWVTAIAAMLVLLGATQAQATWTTIDYPGASETLAHGIDGDNIVGYYSDGSIHHGFVYDGLSYTRLDMPGATATYAWDIDGDNIVGHYSDGTGGHGFVYEGISYTTLDYPGAANTRAYGIDGDRIVGPYWDGSVTSGGHGFVYVIPEPSTLLLLGFGAMMLRLRTKH